MYAHCLSNGGMKVILALAAHSGAEFGAPLSPLAERLIGSLPSP